MTYKQIETSREIRLWFTQVLIPVGIGIGLLASNQNVRDAVSNAKQRIKTKLGDKGFVVVK